VNTKFAFALLALVPFARVDNIFSKHYAEPDFGGVTKEKTLRA
jgi:hypothetical protein